MSQAGSQLLPSGLRMQAYALLDLLLTLSELGRQLTDLDYDSMIIRMIVAEATLHPLLVTQKKQTEMLDWPELPESVRASISRVLIAERANLPRETVRRKVNALIECGSLEDAGHGKVRGNHLLESPAAADKVASGVQAVRKCMMRLEAASRVADASSNQVRLAHDADAIKHPRKQA